MRQQSVGMVDRYRGNRGSWASRAAYRPGSPPPEDAQVGNADARQPRSVSWKGKGLVIRTRNSATEAAEYHHPYANRGRNAPEGNRFSRSSSRIRDFRVPPQRYGEEWGPRDDYYDYGPPPPLPPPPASCRDTGYFSDRYRASPPPFQREREYDYYGPPSDEYRDYYPESNGEPPYERDRDGGGPPPFERHRRMSPFERNGRASPFERSQPPFERNPRNGRKSPFARNGRPSPFTTRMDRDRDSPYHRTEVHDVKFRDEQQDNSTWGLNNGHPNPSSEVAKEVATSMDLPPGFDGKTPARPEPSNNPNNSNSDKRCYLCGNYGHLRSQCTKNNSNPSRPPRLCYSCGSADHLRGKCPSERRSPVFREERVQESAWLSNPEKDRYLKERKCFTCGLSGHPYYNCPRAENRYLKLFEDRERKAKFTILREACWMYKDSDGEMRGPLSLPALSSDLKEGLLQEDVQISDIYGKIEPIALGKLLKIAESDTLVTFLSCMPEAASFLDEAMDHESCKASCVVALQTKLHFVLLETTARWLFASFINDDLTHFLSARQVWGKAAAEHLEDYRAKAVTPRGSNSGVTTIRSPEVNAVDLSYSDVTRFPEDSYNGMLARCEEYLSKSNANCSLSTSVAAIGDCLHSAVIGAARTGILDVTIGKYLDTWMRNRKRDVDVVPDVDGATMFDGDGSGCSVSTMFDDDDEDGRTVVYSAMSKDGQVADEVEPRKSKRLRLKYRLEDEIESDADGGRGESRAQEAEAPNTEAEKLAVAVVAVSEAGPQQVETSVAAQASTAQAAVEQEAVRLEHLGPEIPGKRSDEEMVMEKQVNRPEVKRSEDGPVVEEVPEKRVVKEAEVTEKRVVKEAEVTEKRVVKEAEVKRSEELPEVVEKRVMKAAADEQRRYAITTEKVFPDDCARKFRKEKTIKELIAATCVSKLPIDTSGRKFWRKEMLVKFSPAEEAVQKRAADVNAAALPAKRHCRRDAGQHDEVQSLEPRPKPKPARTSTSEAKPATRSQPAAAERQLRRRPAATPPPVKKKAEVKKTEPKKAEVKKAEPKKAVQKQPSKLKITGPKKPPTSLASKEPEAEKPQPEVEAEKKPEVKDGSSKTAAPTKAPELVLHIFRKAKKNVEADPLAPSASKRTVKLSDLAEVLEGK